MPASLNSVIAKALDERDVVGDLVEGLDGDVRDLVEWAGTYDPDELQEKALEYVDGSSATIYDDEAYELCKENSSLADELARELFEVDGWRAMPMDRLCTLACYVLERDLSQRIRRDSDDLAAIAELSGFLSDVADDNWGLDALSADEGQVKEVVADIVAALEDANVGAAESIMEALADSEDAESEGMLDFARYKENL